MYYIGPTDGFFHDFGIAGGVAESLGVDDALDKGEFELLEAILRLRLGGILVGTCQYAYLMASLFQVFGCAAGAGGHTVAHHIEVIDDK